MGWKKSEFEKNGDKFYCPHDGCDYKNKYASNLARHYGKHTGEKPFQCNFCHQQFAQKAGCKLHIQRSCNGEITLKKEEDKLIDQYIKYSGWKKSDFEKKNGMKYSCPYNGCTYKTRCAPIMERHYGMMHTQDKPYQCILCDQRFTTKFICKQHMCTIHLQEIRVRKRIPD